MNKGFNFRHKLRMEQPKYIIHPFNKAVVCIIECSIPSLPYNAEIHRKFSELDCFNNEFTVKAVAKCNSKDTYNEETGMRIAESRAKAKAVSKALKIMEHYKDIMSQEYTVLNNSVEFFADELCKEKHHINKLISY